MRDLSLHLLDVIENSLRAGARRVEVRIEQRPERNEMVLVVEDDGPGLPVPAAQALDPFFTTKPGKRVGLGLSLLQAAAERAGGALNLSTSPHGGLALRATMLMNHLDRAPLGDLPATLATLLCGSPGVRFRVILIARTRVELDSDRTAERLSAAGAGEVALAFAGELREALDRVEMRP